jgi:hypothetical protein
MIMTSHNLLLCGTCVFKNELQVVVPFHQVFFLNETFDDNELQVLINVILLLMRKKEGEFDYAMKWWSKKDGWVGNVRGATKQHEE